MIYKYCQRCGRRLKSEENGLRGFGETCFKKAKIETKGLTPLITPTRAQEQREIKRLEAQEQRARAEIEEISKARARLQARQCKAQSKSQSKTQGQLKIFQDSEQVNA